MVIGVIFILEIVLILVNEDEYENEIENRYGTKNISKNENYDKNKDENEKRSMTIKKFPRDLFIVGISANSDEDTKQCALNAGMNTFLSKPFSLNELLPTLHRFGIFS